MYMTKPGAWQQPCFGFVSPGQVWRRALFRQGEPDGQGFHVRGERRGDMQDLSGDRMGESQRPGMKRGPGDQGGILSAVESVPR